MFKPQDIGYLAFRMSQFVDRAHAQTYGKKKKMAYMIQVKAGRFSKCKRLSQPMVTLRT